MVSCTDEAIILGGVGSECADTNSTVAVSTEIPRYLLLDVAGERRSASNNEIGLDNSSVA